MSVCAIVLAAGKGTRMKSSLAKVLHPVFHKPMVGHVVETLKALPMVEQTLVVVGHQRQAVQAVLAPYGVGFAVQQEQLGTGHAVLVCQDDIDPALDTVLILCGDTPLLSPQTLTDLFATHGEQQAKLTILTTKVAEPANYGRVVSDQHGQVMAIVEEKDASEEIRAINEINAGVYCVDRHFLFASLAEVGTDNAQGEVYLTDIVAMACEQKLPVARYVCEDSGEVLGVNSRYELSLADDVLQNLFIRQLQDDGVSIQRPATVAIHPSAKIGPDTTIASGVTVAAGVSIGAGGVIGAHCYLQSTIMGEGVEIGPGSLLIGAELNDGDKVAPGQQIILPISS